MIINILCYYCYYNYMYLWLMWSNILLLIIQHLQQQLVLVVQVWFPSVVSELFLSCRLEFMLDHFAWVGHLRQGDFLLNLFQKSSGFLSIGDLSRLQILFMEFLVSLLANQVGDGLPLEVGRTHMLTQSTVVGTSLSCRLDSINGRLKIFILDLQLN